MNLEPIIQSEVSQKEKDKYCILTHNTYIQNLEKWYCRLNLQVSSREKPPSLVAQMVKHLPTMQVTWVQSLGWEDLLVKKMATHSSILAWKIP